MDRWIGFELSAQTGLDWWKIKDMTNTDERSSVLKALKYDSPLVRYAARQFELNFEKEDGIFNNANKKLLRKAGISVFDTIYINGVSAKDRFGMRYHGEPQYEELIKADIISELCKVPPSRIDITPVSVDDKGLITLRPPEMVTYDDSQRYFAEKRSIANPRQANARTGSPFAQQSQTQQPQQPPQDQAEAQQQPQTQPQQADNQTALTEEEAINAVFGEITGPFSSIRKWWRGRQIRDIIEKTKEFNELMEGERIRKSILQTGQPGAVNVEPLFDARDFLEGKNYMPNARVFRKNMQGIMQVQRDFGLVFDNISYIKANTADIGMAIADAGESDNKGHGTMRFNRFWAERSMPKFITNQFTKSHGMTMISIQHVGIHEAGHVAEVEIRRMLGFPEKTVNRRNADDLDYGFDNTYANIVKDAVMRAYEEKNAEGNYTNPEFRRKLEDHSHSKGMTPRALVDKSFQLRKDAKGNIMLFDNEFLKDLNKMKYTSSYGATRPCEFYAEAFADYYVTKNKNQKYEDAGQQRRKEVNPISKAIVEISKELISRTPEGQAYRESFKERHMSNYIYYKPEDIDAHKEIQENMEYSLRVNNIKVSNYNQRVIDRQPQPQPQPQPEPVVSDIQTRMAIQQDAQMAERIEIDFEVLVTGPKKGLVKSDSESVLISSELIKAKNAKASKAV